MTSKTICVALVLAASMQACTGQGDKEVTNNSYNELTSEEARVILRKGTEAPFSGEYWDSTASGTYLCRQCDTPLYRSSDKFISSCGWPSFDDEIEGAVTRQVDADGRRTEILCQNCGGHLGHVFKGERLTRKNVRHCVNSISMRFVPESEAAATREAYFAGGCFWGVEYFFEKTAGVVSAVSGYMGGTVANPSYRQVCGKRTGHLEVVRVTYDPAQVSFEELAKLFFEIHDPTQRNGQGPDIGPQYLSAVFVGTDQERSIAEGLIAQLRESGLAVATKLLPVAEFWEAEEGHQDYYERHNKKPYCHAYKKRFK